jgi:lipopolysaccharide transport system permease protein
VALSWLLLKDTKNKTELAEVKEEEWDLIIQNRKGFFNTNFSSIWRYRDLLLLFVRRDFIAFYKQTILGPLWFFVQPIIATIIFTVIFNKIAHLPTDGVPAIVFYMAGITFWGYFADCINKTSTTFTVNQDLFGKVYFPRIIVPLSVILTNMLKLGVQFLLFLAVWMFYLITQDSIEPNWSISLFPVLIITMALLGLGLGMIISSLTTKYRDLSFLVAFGVQLAMYATPIAYPLSITDSSDTLTKQELMEDDNSAVVDFNGKQVVIAERSNVLSIKEWNNIQDGGTIDDSINWTRIALLANPMTSIIETFKYAFLGSGNIPVTGLIYSICFSIFVFLFGIVIFNRVEKSFIDTV